MSMNTAMRGGLTLEPKAHEELAGNFKSKILSDFFLDQWIIN